MRRTKSEICMKVLEVLDSFGPMGVTRITLRAKVNYAILKPLLTNLKEEKLIEEKRTKHDKIVSAVTQKGKAILEQHKQSSDLNANWPTHNKENFISILATP